MAARGGRGECERWGRGTETVTECSWNLAFARSCGGNLLLAICWCEFVGGSLLVRACLLNT